MKGETKMKKIWLAGLIILTVGLWSNFAWGEIKNLVGERVKILDLNMNQDPFYLQSEKDEWRRKKSEKRDFSSISPSVGKIATIIKTTGGRSVYFPDTITLKLEDSGREGTIDNAYIQLGFFSTLNEAKKCIGKTVWLNGRGYWRDFYKYKTKKSSLLMAKDAILRDGIEDTSHHEKFIIRDCRWAIRATIDFPTGDIEFLLERENGDTIYYGESLNWMYDNFKEFFSEREWFAEDPFKAFPKGWSKKFTDTIRKGKIMIGMTKEMVRLSWGPPKKINRTVTANTVSEQWIYGERYLYFRNGILTSWQD